MLAAIPVLLVAVLALHAAGEPLRRHMERELNASLTGYGVRLGAVRLHPLDGSLDLLDSTIVQTANPDPPVATVPRLHASVHWGALLRGALVADFRFDRPVLNIDVRQAATEVRDRVPIQERGWQEAVEHIYPLKIDRLRVIDGDVIYTPARPFAPLHLRVVNLIADNIRNVRSTERTYPSEVHLDAFAFDAAEIRLDGHADFLAEPHLGVAVYVSSHLLPLWYATPVISRWASIQKGVLSIDGALEYGPHVAAMDLDDLTVADSEVWYVRTAENAAEEQRATERTVAAARDASDNPRIRLHAKQIEVLRSTLGIVSRATDPPYALHVTDATLAVRNFTNQRADGPSTMELRGKFMGSGGTLVRASFRPRARRPNFDVNLRIEDADLRSMNELLRASAGIDVARGSFSLFSELHVRDTSVDGYVKPILRGLDVASREKDRGTPLLHQVHEQIVGGLATLLKNQSRDEVATRTELSGPLTGPRTSLWQTVVGLVRNAYFKAIRPGFEKDAEG
jgi:hypothetical protein